MHENKIKSKAQSGKIVATYLVHLKEGESSIEKIAYDICLEQTVEVIESLVPGGFISDTIVGKTLQIQEISEKNYEVDIAYSESIAANQIPQLLSVLYGNISLKEGIQLIDAAFTDDFLDRFQGPRFGCEGIRSILGVRERPLLASALKPMGRSADELGEMCYSLARGGIDIIKDDHGLVDHAFCTFEERVKSCTQAIQKAADETGKNAMYIVNVSDSYDIISDRIMHAREMGAGGIMISPVITGFDTMRYFAENDDINMPVIAHPGLSGSFYQVPHGGIAQGFLLGTFMRLCGADMVIFPNYTGRFPFSEKACRSIDLHLKRRQGKHRASLPVPAGGMSLESVTNLLDVYGKDVVFLIGSALHNRSPDLEDNAKYFLSLVSGNG